MNSVNARFRFMDGVRQLVRPGRTCPGPARDVRIRVRTTGELPYPVTRATSIKDAMEALGVPHTEVGRVLVDGNDVNFSHPLQAGQSVTIHPVSPPFEVLVPSLLRPRPLRHVAFIADVNVGKLGALMRMLGLDTAYDTTWDDAQIARIAFEQERIVLTRDRALLKRSAISHARLVRACDPPQQLVEVLRHFGLSGPFTPFSRCLHCNEPLRPVPKERILHRLLPLTKRHFEVFHICPSCQRIYWAGSHHDAMLDMLAGLGVDTRPAGPPPRRAT